ncbi:tudor domain-containing protein [Chitinophaga caeni]|nr:hypothetical protein [Chitinophaga caeni]
MIPLNELKPGDWVMAKYEEETKQGSIVQVDHEAKQACVAFEENDTEYWYEPQDLSPIPLDEAQLLKLQFTLQNGNTPNGKLYVKGPFSIIWYAPGHHPQLILHYRDESRQLGEAIMVHQLQNHYHGMTNYSLA